MTRKLNAFPVLFHHKKLLLGMSISFCCYYVLDYLNLTSMLSKKVPSLAQDTHLGYHKNILRPVDIFPGLRRSADKPRSVGTERVAR